MSDLLVERLATEVSETRGTLVAHLQDCSAARQTLARTVGELGAKVNDLQDGQIALQRFIVKVLLGVFGTSISLIGALTWALLHEHGVL